MLEIATIVGGAIKYGRMFWLLSHQFPKFSIWETFRLGIIRGGLLLLVKQGELKFYRKEHLGQIWEHVTTFQPLPFVCIYQIMSFFCSLLFTRLQAQVEQEGIPQHVQCKVGMLSAFLDMVRLLSQLLRSVETFTIFIFILSIILLLITVTLLQQCFYW